MAEPAVTALVSVGRHPASGRPRRAPLDARALELGLGLAGPRLKVLHAGDPEHPVLRDYLGMGSPALAVLALPAEADPPQVILTGLQAEGGEDSGLLPYLLAERLGLPVVADVAAIELTAGRAQLLQALPRGQRRRIEAPLPCVAAVGSAAPTPRQSAYGPARRGRIEVIPAQAPLDEARAAWDWQPARPRPKRLRLPKGGSAAERLRAATAVASGGGQVLKDLAPEEAAEQIYGFLEAEGIIRGPASESS